VSSRRSSGVSAIAPSVSRELGVRCGLQLALFHLRHDEFASTRRQRHVGE
jgi:hypothetical protein